MAFLFANNAASTLAAGIDNVVTTLTVQAGDGLLFPSPGAGESYRCTLTDSSGNIEVVDVTSRSTDQFTIVRGQEGTTALSWLAGDIVSLRLTKEVMEFLVQQDAGSTSDKTATYNAVNGDNNVLINMTNGNNVFLPSAATVDAGFNLFVKNSHTSSITVGRQNAGDTIDEVAGDIILGPTEFVQVRVDALNTGYFIIGRKTIDITVTAEANKALALNGSAQMVADVVGNVTGNVTGALTGNADTCTNAFLLEGNNSAFHTNAANISNAGFGVQGNSAFNVTSNQVTGLVANAKYFITIYGVTRNLGNGGATLVGAQLLNSSDVVLINQPNIGINWPDGNAPYSASFIIDAPTDGILKGRVDSQACSYMTGFRVL